MHWMCSLGLAALVFVSFGLTASGGPFTLGGTQPPLDIPIFEPAVECQGCHGDFEPSNTSEPFPAWAGSMMANAARDPIFWAALDVANNDVPEIGEFCLRCHAPNAWLAGRSEPPDGSVDGCGLNGNIDQTGSDFSGVSCHLCHRMMVNDAPPIGEDDVYYENAKFWIDDVDCTAESGTEDPCRRGPYDYSGGGTPPPHPWIYSDYHTGSDICGNCHNVTSPAHNLLDENGDDTGLPFPIERTFAEWQQSDHAEGGTLQTCQDCHMVQATADPVYACSSEFNNRAGDLAEHRFAGGNTWIPEVLKGEYGVSLSRLEEFDLTISSALDMLQNQSATVEVETVTVAANHSDLLATIKVTNLTGHKLPTGYTEGRRMWLQVVARDGAGETLWESGAYDNATGELTEDPQVKIYRGDLGIWDYNGNGECDHVDGTGNPMFHFALNNCRKLDNRIPPLGFTGMDDLETQPIGYFYPETAVSSGILVNYDTTSYEIPIASGDPPPYSVEVNLFYQTSSKEYIEFLNTQAITNAFPDDCISRVGGTPTLSRGEILYDMWESYDRSPPVNMGTAMESFESRIFADGFESGDTSAW